MLPPCALSTFLQRKLAARLNFGNQFRNEIKVVNSENNLAVQLVACRLLFRAHLALLKTALR